MAEIWKAMASIQISAASLSFIASLVVALSIGSVGLRDGPYKRIIFSLSVADIMQSFGMIVGPFAPPASATQALWSIGNQTTCSAQGTIFIFGGWMFTINSAFLSFYYLCKIKRANDGMMTDAMFSARYEWKIHTFNILLSLAISITGLSLRTFNSAPTGTTCLFAAFPTGCWQDPDIECYEPISTYAAYMGTLHISVTSLCFLGIIVCMGLILWHVAARNKIMKAMLTTNVPGTTTSEQDEIGAYAENLRRLYIREITGQACLYTGAFFLCYGPYAIMSMVYINNAPLSIIQQRCLVILVETFYPLSGFFTILIYARPAIGHLRRNDLERYSWLTAFVMVLKAGGEVPQTSSVEDNYDGFPITAKEVCQEIKSQPFGILNEDSIMSSRVEYTGSQHSRGKKETPHFQGPGYCSHLEEGGKGLERGAVVEVEEYSRGLSFTPETNTRSSLVTSGLSLCEKDESTLFDLYQHDTKAFESKDMILVRALERAQRMGKK